MRNSGTLFANDLRKDRCKAQLVMFEGFFWCTKTQGFWSMDGVQGTGGEVWKMWCLESDVDFGWKSMNILGPEVLVDFIFVVISHWFWG